jgi:bacterioferritin-associated ferredoxin
LFVCICHAVSDGVVRDSIERGAGTVAQVGRSCAAGTGCGSCRIRIQQMLTQHRSGGAQIHECAQDGGDLVEALHRTTPLRNAAAGARRAAVGDRHTPSHAANPAASVR